MSTWGRMLFFNSEKNQILDLGLEQEKMKNKMKKKNYIRAAEKKTQTTKYSNFENCCLNFLVYLQLWSPPWNTRQSFQGFAFTHNSRVKGEMRH